MRLSELRVSGLGHTAPREVPEPYGWSVITLLFTRSGRRG